MARTSAPFRMPDALPDVLEVAWGMLRRAVRDRRHGFHLTTLACTSAEHGVDARIVVLRDADPLAHTLVCHTDARSGKAPALGDDPRCAMIFYDAGLRLQLRARGVARVHTAGDTVDARWHDTPLHSRRCYLAPLPPGTLRDVPDTNLPEAFRAAAPTPEQSRPARANFAVLTNHVRCLDVLHLASDGHLRAVFWFDPGGSLARSSWVTP